MGKTEEVKAQFRASHPGSYLDIVRIVVAAVASKDDGQTLDPDRIALVDDGDYQGTLVFIIAATGYQPYDYWFVKVSYGSCSGCDTLQRIAEYSSDPPTEKQVKDYWTLALHVAQGLTAMQPSDIA